MIARRDVAERLAATLTGVAIAALLVTLVAASFVLTPRPAARAGVDVAAASTHVVPVARGGRHREVTSDVTPLEMGEPAVPVPSATAGSIAATVEPTVDPTAQPTAEPTPEPTAEPTPEPAPEPTPAPTPRRTTAPVAASPVVVTASTQEAELRMLALMNASRGAGGLVPLALDAKVTLTARAHSLVESQVGYVYHDGPDGLASVRDSAACGTGWYGENTGKVWQGNVDRLHIEFMSEPWIPINHRTNIMDPNFRRVGVGAVQGPDALYMTMVFCR